VRPQPGFKPEIDQRARRIGRELDAGAGLLEPLGLFQYDDAKAVTRKRERGGQPADAGPSDNDDARGRQDMRSRKDMRSGKTCAPEENSDGGVVQGALRRSCGIGCKSRIVAVERRAIGADVLGILAHVAVHMGMVEWRFGAHAHKVPGADLDDRNARVIMEVGNNFVGHGLEERLYWMWF
jgi:hypothetical protein